MGNKIVYRIYSSCIIVSLVILSACNDFAGNEENSSIGQLIIALEPLTDNQKFFFEDLPNAQQIIITVSETGNDTVLNRKKFRFNVQNQAYLSEEIELKSGQYQIEEFMIANGKGKHLAFTPLQRNIEAYNKFKAYDIPINKPLPISIEVDNIRTDTAYLEILPAPVNYPYDYRIKGADVEFSYGRPFECEIPEQIDNYDSLIEAKKQEIDSIIGQSECKDVNNCRVYDVAAGDGCGPFYAYGTQNIDTVVLNDKLCQLNFLKHQRFQQTDETQSACDIALPHYVIIKNGKCMACEVVMLDTCAPVLRD